jgi:FAD/FMN-containing dehydrogenase
MAEIQRRGSWGLPAHSPKQAFSLAAVQHNPALLAGDFALPIGLGRSYGDVGLNSGHTIVPSSDQNHFLHFDPVTGSLKCQAGVSLAEIQRTFIPQGYSLIATPGTAQVSVGGAIANDVHGKNHHRVSSFGTHVTEITLLRTNGEVIVCSQQSNAEMFEATIGGLGLTGFILDATFNLKKVNSAYLVQDTLRFENVAEFLQISKASEQSHEYSVAWVDTSKRNFGRGFLMRANIADDGNFSMPPAKAIELPMLPFGVVNKFSNAVLASAYRLANSKEKTGAMVDYQKYFYPLDAIAYWNHAYGPKGFYQYQFVVPNETAEAAVNEILKEVALSGNQSFLSVLKTLGSQKPAGLLSFTRPGVTVALDFENRGVETLALFSRLDKILGEAGGALNLSKDVRMPKSLFEQSYSRYQELEALRDPGISSGLSRRLMGF